MEYVTHNKFDNFRFRVLDGTVQVFYTNTWADIVKIMRLTTLSPQESLCLVPFARLSRFGGFWSTLRG